MFIVPCKAFPLYATAYAASVCKLWHRLYYSQDEDKGAPSHQHTHPPIDNKEKKKTDKYSNSSDWYNPLTPIV